MKIKEIVSQHRRDFRAIYVCEHCGYEMEDSGYDDAFFHTKVIPDKVCPKCGKKAPGELPAACYKISGRIPDLKGA